MNKKELITILQSNSFDKKIVTAFDKVDREKFVPLTYQGFAYENRALPIGFEQTISQPFTIAFMLEHLDLKNRQKILEVGSGSGYVLALMNEIAKNSKIYATERIPVLVKRSQNILKDIHNIKIFQSDYELGLKKYAPYDRILVSAAAEELPEELIKQLKENGTMVCPVQNSIVKTQMINGKPQTESYYGFSFVPLL